MPCKSPIKVNNPTVGNIHVRCKQCLECRILKHSQLQSKMQLEYITAQSAQFLTLTYAEPPETEDYQDFSLFMKRLRSYNRRKGNQKKIQYFAVGEYGENNGRWHFHAMLFHHLQFLDTGRCNIDLWPHGSVHIGTVTPSSISYIGQYSLKFLHKEEPQPRAHWSLKPALGSSGMKYIADYMVKNKVTLPENLNSIKIDGKTYMLDGALMSVMENTYKDAGLKFPKKTALGMATDHTINLKLNMDDFRYDCVAQEIAKERDYKKRFLNETF